MSSIRVLYEAAVKYEHSSLAHYIINLLQEGKIQLEDDESIIDFSQANQQQVKQMVEGNMLGFQIIRVFALKHTDNKFAFIYAKDKQDAIDFFRKEFRSNPKNCHEYPMDFVIEKGNRFISFRELKQEFEQSPAFIGFYERKMVYS